MQALLDDDSTKPQAMDAIRGMIDRIEVTAGERRGEPHVLLVGALASVLQFASAPQKQNAAPEDGVGRVLMVAGTGFVEARIEGELSILI